MIYPETEIKTADVMAAEGALPVGCEIKNGSIVPAFAPSEVTANAFESVDCAYGSTALGLAVIKSGTMVYYSKDLNTFSKVANYETDTPFVFEDYEGDRMRMVLADNTLSMRFYSKGSSYSKTNYGICGGQLKCGRLFAIDREDNYKLRWSGEDGAYDWVEGISGAGWVKLESKRGKILNLVNFGENLIAVREQGLTVISAFGTPENFKILSTDTAAPKIVKDTAAVVCGKLIFFAEGGLYAYDGNKITPLPHNLENETENPTYAAAYGNNYLLCCRSKRLGREVVLACDCSGKFSHIVDVPAQKLVVTDCVHAYYPLSACTLEKCSEYKFISGKINFGTSERKHLNGIEIESDKPVDLTVSNGRTERVFKGVNGRLAADMCGVNFVFCITGNAEIKSIKAYAEAVSGI